MTSSPRQASFSYHTTVAPSAFRDPIITDDMLLQPQPLGEGVEATPVTEVT